MLSYGFVFSVRQVLGREDESTQRRFRASRPNELFLYSRVLLWQIFHPTQHTVMFISL